MYKGQKDQRPCYDEVDFTDEWEMYSAYIDFEDRRIDQVLRVNKKSAEVSAFLFSTSVLTS
jgi:hypothetical protein